ncbi:MAG: indole-3-glycerol phosphate synthase TrpC [Thermodesulfovibrionales bacterium]
MSVLSRIVEQKKNRLLDRKTRVPFRELKAAVKDAEPARDFRAAVTRGAGSVRLIAEIKKASPSKGLIRQDFDHRAIARLYEEKQVDAISVLTEEDFFQGSLAFLPEVRTLTTRPLLRKDFLFDEYQVFEARASQADAILLIAAILTLHQADDLMNTAHALGLGVLFEVHDETDLEKALRINAPVIGINNRNLSTLAIDLNTTFSLKKQIPGDRVVVSESGIEAREDVVRLEQSGIDAMLIGTSFMKSADIGAKIDELQGLIP